MIEYRKIKNGIILSVLAIFMLSPGIYARDAKYTGEKVIFDFYKTDIKNIFKILNQVSGKNFAIDNDVTGKVTLCFEKPVPWDQALELILKMNHLGKEVEGDIIRIALKKRLIEEESLKQKILKQKRIQGKSEKHKTEFIPLNYAGAIDIIPHIEKIITKGDELNEDQQGKASIDERTNSIIITDTPAIIAKAKNIIKHLDKTTPQVMIEARIIETSSNFANEIGVEWGLRLGDHSIQTGGDELGGTYGYNMAMNFPTSASEYGKIGINFTRIAGSPFILDATLKFMESEGEGKIISAPRILTLDNEKARISQGIEYPYLERDSSGLATIVFKDIDLVLEVTPHITPDKRISMDIEILKSDIGSKIEGQLSFITKQAQTKLLVNNNDTVVIGGIKKNTNNFSSSKAPWLGKLPIIGWFFGSESKIDRQEELIIFITPKIVQL
ncbi:MAG: type IV pilus secretin PilQ [Deltaproteobacteria bacterium]|nr:type IV pilus secretin PilQ [Deltaproteobacteria bacterium]